jgi:hypothetical protein
MFEIKFVEHEVMFHSIGKRLPFVYEMKCEAFRASQEQIATGVEEVDQVGSDNSYPIELKLSPIGGISNLNYFVGETVFQSTNSNFNAATCTGVIKEWFAANTTLMIYNIKGNFAVNHNVIGQSSGAIYNLASTDTMTDYSYYDLFDNKQLNTDAGEILDFSEQNPFGTP